MTKWIPFAPAAFAAGLSLTAFAQPAAFHGLGFATANDVSGDGRVVVGHSASGEVIRWTAAGGPVLLPASPGGLQWSAAAVSGDGSVIVGLTHQSIPGADCEAARWSEASGLVAQGFPNGGYSLRSVLSGVSADGRVAVGEGSGYGAPACPFGFYTLLTTACRQTQPDGPLHKLNPIGGQNSCRARAVSGDGSTSVGESFGAFCGSESNRQACLWVGNGQATPLGFLSGYAESAATGASADGSVIVGYGWNPQVFGQRAFRWTGAGGIESLALLPGTIGSEPADLSANGSVVVGGCTLVVASVMHGRACVWDGVHGVRAVSDVLAGLGVITGGWTLTHAVGVSADGRTVAGNGINPAGEQEAWIAFLGDAVCYAGCNRDGVLTVGDFGCFQTKFVATDPYADCNADAQLTVADFGCFQTTFVAGCP